MIANVADETGVRVMEVKCETCIFRPGNLMMLKPGRVRSMVKQCKANDGVIPCHETLSDGRQAVCRGFYDAHAMAIWPLRFAKGVGAIVWHKP